MANSKQFGPGQKQPHTDGRGQSGQGNYSGGSPGNPSGNPAYSSGGAQPSQAQKRSQAMTHGGSHKQKPSK